MAEFSFLDGTSVSVVGNAQSLLAHRHGTEIDLNEIVIRMNRSLPVDAASQGRRTDMLAFSTFFHVSDVYGEFNPRWLVWMSPKRRQDAARSGSPDSTLYYDMRRWDALARRLGSRPSVGAMVLDLVSAAAPREVSIFGFDFKRTGTTYQARPHVGPHDYGAEQRYCDALAAENGWKVFRDFDFEPSDHGCKSI